LFIHFKHAPFSYQYSTLLPQYQIPIPNTKPCFPNISIDIRKGVLFIEKSLPRKIFYKLLYALLLFKYCPIFIGLPDNPVQPSAIAPAFPVFAIIQAVENAFGHGAAGKYAS